MNEEDRSMALDINAMLMAFHNNDFVTMQTILLDREEPLDLLLGGISVSLSMIDELLEFIAIHSADIDLSFADLIKVRGQYISDLETDK